MARHTYRVTARGLQITLARLIRRRPVRRFVDLNRSRAWICQSVTEFGNISSGTVHTCAAGVDEAQDGVGIEVLAAKTWWS